VNLNELYGNFFFNGRAIIDSGTCVMSDKKQSQFLIRTWILPCLVMLFAMMLSAGCNDSPSGVSDAVQVTTVPSVPATGLDADTCTFDRLIGNAEVHLSIGNSCYFESHTPMEYLNDLRMHPHHQVMVLDVPDTWITPHDAELLMLEIDSNAPAAPVVSPISSYWPFNQTSTVGNEALFLLEGYRTGKYPPALCSLYYFHPDRSEMRSWWNNYGKPGLIDDKEAIRIVRNTCPELGAYPSDELPPKSIRTEKSPGGWYVAFIQEGSGLPILSARCYYVGNDRTVRLTGMVNHSIMVLPQDFSAQKCG
jgi:hypothetical protein